MCRFFTRNAAKIVWRPDLLGWSQRSPDSLGLNLREAALQQRKGSKRNERKGSRDGRGGGTGSRRRGATYGNNFTNWIVYEVGTLALVGVTLGTAKRLLGGLSLY